MNKEFGKKYFWPSMILSAVILLGPYFFTGIFPFDKFEFAAVILAVIAIWYQLFVKPLPLVARLVLAAAVVGLFILSGNVQERLSGNIKTTTPFTSSPIAKLSPQVALQNFIQKQIKDEFLPEKYDVIKDDSLLVMYSNVGRAYADNYSLRWRKGDSQFATFVSYDKKHPDDLIGYAINVFVKDPTLKGSDLARIYLKNVPEKGWWQSGPNKPYSSSESTSETAYVIIKEGINKTMLQIQSIDYKKLKTAEGPPDDPEIKFFPNEPLIKIGAIEFKTYLPNNLYYNMPEELLEALKQNYKYFQEQEKEKLKKAQ